MTSSILYLINLYLNHIELYDNYNCSYVLVEMTYDRYSTIREYNKGLKRLVVDAIKKKDMSPILLRKRTEEDIDAPTVVTTFDGLDLVKCTEYEISTYEMSLIVTQESVFWRGHLENSIEQFYTDELYLTELEEGIKTLNIKDEDLPLYINGDTLVFQSSKHFVKERLLNLEVTSK